MRRRLDFQAVENDKYWRDYGWGNIYGLKAQFNLRAVPDAIRLDDLDFDGVGTDRRAVRAFSHGAPYHDTRPIGLTLEGGWYDTGSCTNLPSGFQLTSRGCPKIAFAVTVGCDLGRADNGPSACKHAAYRGSASFRIAPRPVLASWELTDAS